VTKRYKARDERILERLAHALAWDMSVAKASSPRGMYRAQTVGCRAHFDEYAKRLLPCLRRARLRILPSEDR
jgi:hypothetical protein